MPEIEIRPAQPADIATLAAIDHSYKSNYVWQMNLTMDDGSVGINFREIRLPRAVNVDYPRLPRKLIEEWTMRSAVLVGILGGAPVGYISLSENIAPTTAWVTDLAVSPEVRRKGIASALMIAAQEWASHRNNRRMIVEMQSKNQAAIRMAKKLGYEFCGYNDHYYANQDIALFFGQFLR
ncbi:MAG: GNAT family N-acetyltransferase [Chloroflexi bacterium]|nr:GNAT family N-acetyltransferase [Chloroflexota bacterium]